MPTFPREFQTVILPYARLFSRRVYTHVQLLLLGAILAPGKRTVTAVLRIVGLGRQPAWHKYHRVLSRADPIDSPLSPRDALASLMDAAAYAA